MLGGADRGPSLFHLGSGQGQGCEEGTYCSPAHSTGEKCPDCVGEGSFSAASGWETLVVLLSGGKLCAEFWRDEESFEDSWGASRLDRPLHDRTPPSWCTVVPLSAEVDHLRFELFGFYPHDDGELELSGDTAWRP